jgi:hypothetical protein
MPSAEFVESQADLTEFVPAKKSGEKSPTQVIQEL